VILVAVGSAYGIHMVTNYLVGLKDKEDMSREEHREFVLSIVRRIGKVVFLAAITTIAGFISFCFTRVIPIREFGIFAAFGVLAAFLPAVTLIPSLRIIRGPRNPRGSGQLLVLKENTGSVDMSIARMFTDIARRKGTVIFAVVFVMAFSIWGLSKVIIDNIFVEYFKPTTDIARSDRFIREKFGGSNIVSVVVEAENTEALLMPEVLLALDGRAVYLEERVPEAGKVMGFTDFVKRVNQVFNADESPDGLRPARVSSNNDAEFGFGDFGFAGFGFEDSGFGFFDDAVSAQSESSVIEEDYGQPFADISAADIFALLRSAASSGRSRSMDANELVREIEKIVNFEGAAYYEIPADPFRYGKTTPEELSRLISNYLVLLSGNISAHANDPLMPTSIKTTIQLRTVGNIDSDRAVGRIREFIADNFPQNINTIIGGNSMVGSSLNRLVVESQIISVVISILVVFLIITLSNRSLVAGIIGITPISICVFINFAIMGFAGIKLNIGTSMVAGLTVGIGIDYAIHFLESYKREYRTTGGKGDFIFKAYLSSGRAIIINAVSVGAGFAVLLFSQFVMLQEMGFLIAFAMFSSALVSLTVIPVLLSIIKPKFISKE
jgi:predicted RND superfamily exporter protein